jgi:hypothetical protein
MLKIMRKIIFLDVDGVMNSRHTLARVRPGGGIIGIDPYLALLVDRIIQVGRELGVCEEIRSIHRQDSVMLFWHPRV